MKTLLSLILILALSTTLWAEKKRPNIMIFLVDDMGLMDTSVPFVVDKNGKPSPKKLNKFYQTPNMENLASKGIRFSHFYANSVCSPSRSSLLTGQFSARHKTTQWINPTGKNAGPKDWNWQGIKAKDVTLQNILRKDGYTTIHVGKAHLGPFKHLGSDPKKVGFDHNIGGTAIGRPHSYYGKQNFGKGNIRHVPHLEKYHGTKTFLTEALTLETKKLLSKVSKKDKPFFLHMSHYALHSPFHSDPRFAPNYKKSGRSKPLQAFATLVEGMDKSLGDLTKHLESIGEAENTLIIFLGDNGSDAPIGGTHAIASSAPFRGKKGTHFEGGMLAPFIIGWAKPNPNSELQKKFPVKQGIISKNFATICDILPTVLEVTGASVPNDYKLDGHSLTGHMKKHQGKHSQNFLMHFPHPHNSSHYTVLRRGNWKLIYHYKKPKGKKVQLFKLSKDPYEFNNLAYTHITKANELISEMQKQLEKCEAQYSQNKKGEKLKPEPIAMQRNGQGYKGKQNSDSLSFAPKAHFNQPSKLY